MEKEELIDLSPQEYLNPDKFITALEEETNEETNNAQYKKGLYHSNNYYTVGVAFDGSWFAVCKGASVVTGECIGRSPCTAALLRGLLAGKARFVVNRVINNKKLVPFTIKKHGEVLGIKLSNCNTIDTYNGVSIYYGFHEEDTYFSFMKDDRIRMFSTLEAAKTAISILGSYSDES